MANTATKAKQAGQMFQEAVNAKEQRQYEQAVDKFQRVVEFDPADETGFAAPARQQIIEIKDQLAQEAAPYRAAGKAAFEAGDPLRARKAYRQAITIDPYDQTLVLELQAVDSEVRKLELHPLDRLIRRGEMRLPDGSDICPWH